MNNDLISREALKEELEKSAVTILGWGKAVCLDKANKIIDNAPTVDITKNQYYDKGFITAMKLYARPKGEWEYKNYLWVCNKCQNSFMLQSNFCPNCGAEMRKGGAE